MLYDYFLQVLARDKRGITFVEIMTVVIVLGILTAVAVPVFSANISRQRAQDCVRLRIMIATTVQQCMSGMIDNGKKQDTITFYDKNESTTKNYFQKVEVKAANGTVLGTINEPCYRLDELTVGQVRNGYRTKTNGDPATAALGVNEKTYEQGCEEENHPHLKKFSMKDTPLQAFFANQEMPMCPFDEANIDNTDYGTHHFYVTSDGRVFCDNPDCYKYCSKHESKLPVLTDVGQGTNAS